MQLLPGKFTPTVVESVARLGAWMPFTPAARMLGHFIKVTVSEAKVRRTTEGAGKAYEQAQAAQVERLHKQTPEPPEGPEVQQLSVDGAMVPLLKGRWAEVKTLAIGSVKQEMVKGQLEARAEGISYFSRMADHETFARLALVEVHRRGTERAGTVCGVNDGADWEQGFMDYHRSDAVRILDWGHAAGYVAKAGQAVFGVGRAETSEWLGKRFHELKHEVPDLVLASLRQLRTVVPERVEADKQDVALKVVEESLQYLEKRREQIRYAEFVRLGYPIGSGMVESANKLVVEARLKGSGMHWQDVHVNPMLALRNVVCSDRWDEAWAQISQQLRQEVRERKAALRAERAKKAGPGQEAGRGMAAAAVREDEATPLAPKAGRSPRTTKACAASGPRRPSEDHPWRHMPLGRPRHLPAPRITLPET